MSPGGDGEGGDLVPFPQKGKRGPEAKALREGRAPLYWAARRR